MALKTTRISGNWILGGYNQSASLTTSQGSNRDLTYTAKSTGSAGNAITVSYVIAGNDTPLSVDVTDTDIVVNVATSGAGAATSTASQVRAAVNGDTDAAALVTAALASGSTGAGVVQALAETPLTGGREKNLGAGSGAIRTVRS